MAAIIEDRERRVVPRLRNFESGVRSGELDCLRPFEANPFSVEMLKNVLDDWESQPGISVAADLVSVAVTLGHNNVATDAARFLISRAETPPAARSLAMQLLGEEEPPINGGGAALLEGPSTFVPSDLHSQIHRVRLQLHNHPLNPILWTNLAIAYTTLGQPKQARRAIRIALSLAPDNRFVLRDAARLFLHQQDGDAGHKLLVRAKNLKGDPWLLAAEIATAGAIGKTSQFIKVGQNFLDRGIVRPQHLSELASAIGTEEAFSGNGKGARKLLRRSLEEPSENAVAQAAWLARNVPGAAVLGAQKTISFEANAWLAREARQWRYAILQSYHWQNDQPFSSRPAVLGSFTACTALEQYEDGIAFAKRGLVSNPQHATLQNNLAFAMGHLGRITEAQRILDQINLATADVSDRIAVNATRGLIAFRQGELARGRSFYRDAIALGESHKDHRHAVARLYHAFEELRQGTAEAERYRQEALAAAKMLTSPEHLALIERLKEYKPVSTSAPAVSVT